MGISWDTLKIIPQAHYAYKVPDPVGGVVPNWGACKPVIDVRYKQGAPIILYINGSVYIMTVSTNSEYRFTGRVYFESNRGTLRQYTASINPATGAVTQHSYRMTATQVE